MSKTMWMVVLILLVTSLSYAQETPRGDVSAAYSFLHVGAGGNEQGGSFSAVVNANRWFGIAGDFGVYNQSPIRTFTYLAGPRFSIRNRSRVTPYVETLVGGAHFTATGGGSANAFAVLAGGGLDLGLSQVVTLRPQADYIAFRIDGSMVNAARISMGVAFRFGGTGH